MKLNTSSHYETGHCWKGFQGQRSRVKVTARPRHSGTHFHGVVSRITCFLL